MIRSPWLPAAIAALLAAASLLPTAAASQSAPAADPGRERCYGVAKAGQNDGLGVREAPGTSTVDYQGDAWVWVAAGDCLTAALPLAPDGSRRRGALEPLDRDRP